MNVSKIGEFNGLQVDEIELTNDLGVVVNIMTYGVVVRDWKVPVDGELRSVVLGFETFEPYPDHSPHLGSLAGRVANRIANGTFELDSKTYDLPRNEEPHHLHGGPEGLGRQVWKYELDEANNAVRFTHHSPDGAMGYPGNVDFVATYALDGYALTLTLEATTDQRTPISLVQHQYFNLGTGDNVLDHKLRLASDRYTPTDDTLKPTGEILPAKGTIYDFSAFKNLRDTNGVPIDFDLNTVLPEGFDAATPAAEVIGPDEKLHLKLYTDRPGVQLYNGVWTDIEPLGLNGKSYKKHSGLCLEDQAFPNAVNQSNFPPIICGPDTPYNHTCKIEIAPKA